ncbi:Glucan endo-1,3-beta-glucosidase [Thalictrum thalictroides]|uniref:Glucan endo-1,3-beta-glucosidase n=1 Tax=Thalictrum thalictroides TaxID=46969 RepID=A0A7J6VNR9_THATH|nr:Glucan endo-1,3-beta-glucosidase [Thalictrum thalictroides]
MRIYDPHQETLQALRGSNIELVLDVPLQDLQNLALDASAANNWVQTNIRGYLPDVKFRYIGVGNEVSPINPNAHYVSFFLPAMRNVYNALAAVGLQDQIKVSTVIETGVLGESYPPSQGSFKSDVHSYLDPILAFLVNNQAPILVNVHRYISHINIPNANIQYALFTSPSAVVSDGQLRYQNLFDAIVDAFYSALEKTIGSGLVIVVSETGWPSNGGPDTSVENARTYNQNLVQHVGRGTPKKPGQPIETYVFAMFNENQKGGPEYEKYWGLFYPNKQPVYPINLV